MISAGIKFITSYLFVAFFLISHFRDMLRFLSDEQYSDVILVAEMIPHIEVVVKPRGAFIRLLTKV